MTRMAVQEDARAPRDVSQMPHSGRTGTRTSLPHTRSSSTTTGLAQVIGEEIW